MRLRTMCRRSHLASRPWTGRERAIVWRGLTGRMGIAIEPLLGMLFFGMLTWGIVWRSRVAAPHDLWILWPIFALMALAFGAYFVAVLVAPLVAYLQTFKSIYIIDGFIRYRCPDDFSEPDANGYVAVLYEDEALCCEWEWFGSKRLPNLKIPALCEFSEFGGIHRIDGKSTGVLPDEELPLLAIGIASRR